MGDPCPALGLGEAFEFLFDATDASEDGNIEDARLDKLCKDLVFMWRSRLYSDVRIALTGSFSSTNHESATTVFSSHCFVSRCPYFQYPAFAVDSQTHAQ